MRFTMHKLYWAWNFEEEEKWLNEMSAKGLNLVGVGFGKFVFEEGTPGEYHFHIEWLKHFPSHPETVSYIHFLEETGVEHVGSFKMWAYFRKKTSDGVFDLFSDIDSRIIHYKRIRNLLLCLFPLEILAFWINATSSSIANFGCSSFLGILIILITIGMIKIMVKIKHLKKERILHE